MKAKMNDKANNDDDIIKLFQSSGFGTDRDDPRSVVAILLTETVKFRDKLKEETGNILTVSDTRTALSALKSYFNTGSLPEKITSEQRALTKIWIDRLTLLE